MNCESNCGLLRMSVLICWNCGSLRICSRVEPTERLGAVTVGAADASAVVPALAAAASGVAVLNRVS